MKTVFPEITVTNAIAIQKAIDSLRGKDGFIRGGVIHIPPGYYVIKKPIVVAKATNVTIRGAGTGVSIIAPSGAGIKNKPVLQLVNCRFCTLQDLDILGNTDYPPAAGIESRSDLQTNPSDVRLLNERNSFRNLNIGHQNYESISLGSFSYGIRFTAADDSDGNNGESLIENVNIAGFGRAAISIEHSNSLLHQISGGRIAYGPVAVSLQGGSFQMTGSNIFVEKTDFEFLDPQGTLNGKNVAGYYHASLIQNVSAESTSALLITRGC